MVDYSLLPEPSPRGARVDPTPIDLSTTSSSPASASTTSRQPNGPSSFSPLPSLHLPPLPLPPPSLSHSLTSVLPSTFSVQPSPLSAILPPSPLFMVTTTLASGCDRLYPPSLRVHPTSTVSSLTFRMVCLHCPSLLKPSYQHKVAQRLHKARANALLLAEALWVEEEWEEGCRSKLQRLGRAGVSSAVLDRAEVAERHSRWRVEARRSGRVVELTRAMLHTGLLTHIDKFHFLLPPAQPPSTHLHTARSTVSYDTEIGRLEQKGRGEEGREGRREGERERPAPSSQHSKGGGLGLDVTLNGDLLMEECLYPFRHVACNGLAAALQNSAEAPAASPPQPMPEPTFSSQLDGKASAAVFPLPPTAATPRDASCASSSSPYLSGCSSADASSVAFLPRAWCDGAYLRSSVLLSSSHVTPHSTVYLMLECPHAESRAHHRQMVYAAPEHRGFYAFVRHPQSRSLLRVVARPSTKMWKVKAAVIRHCYQWKEEQLNRLDAEAKKKKEEGEGGGGGEEGSGVREGVGGAKASPRSEASATVDLSGNDDEEEELPSLVSLSDRCVLVHHGRVCFDCDSLSFAAIGPGDVLTLLDKVHPIDPAIEPLRYSDPQWYRGKVCGHLVRRSTVFDVQALLTQLRERVDELLYRPRHYGRLKAAFRRMDPHHSELLNEQESAYTAHTLLRLVQQRIASSGEDGCRLWLDDLEGQLGGSQVSWGRFGFPEPSFFPTDAATAFPHFLRMLSDSVVELMRSRHFDFLLPSQPFVKPLWWSAERHLNADNHRLLHTVLSTLPDYSAHKGEALKTDGEWTAAHVQTFLGRVGLSTAHSSLIPQHSTGGGGESEEGEAGGRAELEDAYILSQVLKAEQERQLVDQLSHNFHRGFTFSARRRLDDAVSVFLHQLHLSLSEDLELDEAEQAPRHLLSYFKTGLVTALQFLLRPVLLFFDLSHRLWTGRRRGGKGWLWFIWSIGLIAFYSSALCVFFYIPFVLVAVYFAFAADSSESTVSILECLLPLCITCVLIVYQVNGALSAQLLSLENDEQRLSEAYQQSRLLCLEMRANPVLLDYTGEEEEEGQHSTGQAQEKGQLEAAVQREQPGKVALPAQQPPPSHERERLWLLRDEVGHVFEAASDASSAVGGVEGLLAGKPAQSDLAHDGGRQFVNARPSLSVNDFGKASASSASELPQPKPLPPPGPQKFNAIGWKKSRRLRLSHTTLHWRLGPEERQDSLHLSHRCLFLLLSFVHTVVPGLYRVQMGEAFFGSTWFDQLVSGGNWVCIPSIYLFLTNLGRACMGYHQLAVRLSNVTLLADAVKAFESKLPFYLDLRLPTNLEYWLALRELAKRADQQLIGMMAGAVIVDAFLLLAAVIRVLFYHKSVDLFNVIAITDIVLYSLFIVVFLLIVVQANTVLSVDHVQ